MSAGPGGNSITTFPVGRDSTSQRGGARSSAAAVLGLYASYVLSIASGGTVVLTSTVFFTLALLFAPTKGIVARRRRQRSAEASRVHENEAMLG